MESILGDFGVVCIAREGTDMEQLLETEDLFIRHRENITLLNAAVENSISSSAVRKLLGSGQSAAYLLPNPVLRYIQEKKLYGCSSDQHV